MRIRAASISDCPAISSAYLASWRAGYASLLDPEVLEVEAQARSSRDWGSTLRQSDRVVFVADDEAEGILGVVECEHRPGPGCLPWLQMLYVVPSAWGTGAAVQLLDAALSAAEEEGHPTIWLEVVEPHARARRFYEREGFEVDAAMEPGSNGLFNLIYYRYGEAVP